MNNQSIPNSIVWQSTAIGAFGGACVGFAAGRFGGLDPTACAVAGMGIGSMFAHVYTLTVITKPTQPRQFVDPKPSFASETDYINVMTHNDDVSYGTFGKIPTDRRRAVILARGLVQGKPFTESQWTGSHQPFTTREFTQIRTEFLLAKWVAQRGRTPQRGYKMTSAGMAVMRYYATRPRERRAAQNAARALGRV